MHMLKTFSGRLIVSVMVVFVLCFLLTDYVVMRQFSQRFANTVEQHLEITAHMVAKELDHEVVLARNMLKNAAATIDMTMLASPQGLDRYLAARKNLLLLFDQSLFVVGVDGTTVIAQIGQNSTNSPVITDPHALTITTLFLDDLTPLVRVAIPITADQELQGYLVGTMHALRSDLLGNLAQTNIHDSGYYAVVTTAKRVVMHPDRGLIGKQVKKLNTSFYRDSGQSDHIATAVAALESVEWLLVVHYPSQQVLAPLNDAVKASWFTVLLGCVMVLLLSVLVCQRLTRPLRRLTAEVEALSISQGETVISVTSDDEVGLLANKFNRVLAQLYDKECELAAARDFYQRLSDNSTDWEFQLDGDGSLQYLSLEAEEITGYSRQELFALPGGIDSLIYEGDLEQWKSHTHQVQDNGRIKPIEFRLKNKDGELRWISHVCRQLHAIDGGVIGLRGSNRDITHSKCLEDQLRVLSEVVNQSSVAIVVTDAQANITYVNYEFSRLTGYSPNEVMGQNPRLLKSQQTPLSVYARMWERITSGHQWQGEILNMRKDGSIYWESIRIFPIYDGYGSISHYASIKHDITASKEAEAQLQYISCHDSLTGVYNRQYFDDQLQVLRLGRKYPVSIILGDVDGLKRVNDEQGHDAGDALLVAAVAVLQEGLRVEDTLARIGGDEFVILLPSIDHEHGKMIIQRLKDTLSRRGRETLSVSLGLATAEKPDGLDQALKDADAMMYADKKSRYVHR